MTRKLREIDRSAVDLLLDRSAVATGLDPQFVAPSNAAGSERVQAASRMLHLLDALPAQDPPADLVARTMRRIDRADRTAPGEHQGNPSDINREHRLM